MVGMVLAIMRGAAPESCLQLALEPDRDFNTPMAPELGLFLVRPLHFCITLLLLLRLIAAVRHANFYKSGHAD
jgi:hypothetical protein